MAEFHSQVMLEVYVGSHRDFIMDESQVLRSALSDGLAGVPYYEVVTKWATRLDNKPTLARLSNDEK